MVHDASNVAITFCSHNVRNFSPNDIIDDFVGMSNINQRKFNLSFELFFYKSSWRRIYWKLISRQYISVHLGVKGRLADKQSSLQDDRVPSISSIVPLMAKLVTGADRVCPFLQQYRKTFIH